jgi:MFS family permease
VTVNIALLTRRYVALNGLSGLPIGLCAPVLVLLLAARGLDVASIGALLAIYGFTTAALELPTGGLADVLGRRPVLIAASALFLLSTLLLGLGAGAALLTAGIILEATGRALDSGPLQAWYVDSVHAFEPDADMTSAFARGRSVGMLTLAVGAVGGGAVAAIAAAGWLPLPVAGDAPVLALSLPFLLAAGVISIRAIAQFVWLTEPPRGPHVTLRHVLADIPRTIRIGVRTCARAGTLRRIVVLCGVIGVVLATVELLTPLWLSELLGGESRAVASFAVFSALGGFAMAAGSAVAPALSRWLGSYRTVVMMALIATAVAVALFSAPIFLCAAFGYVGVYFALGAPEPLLDDLTHRAVTSGERTTVLSVQSLALRLCGSAGAFTAGRLASGLSMTWAWALVIAVLAAGLVAAAGLTRPATVSVPTENEPTA